MIVATVDRHMTSSFNVICARVDGEGDTGGNGRIGSNSDVGSNECCGGNGELDTIISQYWT